MSAPPAARTGDVASAVALAPNLLRDAIALTKPGITRMVVVTAGVGFALAAFSRAWTAGDLLLTASLCLVGTALASSGANALNQVAERRFDADMPRTRNRPLPAGRLSPGAGLAIALSCSAAGVAALALAVNLTAAVVALATIALYIAAYTPMKRVTILSTVVGAIPGALPALLGWVAAAQGSGAAALAQAGGWTLFLILFTWQMPHFLAIAWMHRDGYACAGFRVLSVGDETGRQTAWICLIWTLALVASALLAPIAIDSVSGWIAAPTALALGGLMVRGAWRFVRERSRSRARSLFLLSILHLPATLFALALDAIATALLST